jgi:hypothetical protein
MGCIAPRVEAETVWEQSCALAAPYALSCKVERRQVRQLTPTYSLAGVVHRLWRRLSISSAKEAVNNSARFGKFDSGSVTNDPYNALRRSNPNILAQSRSLIVKITHTQVRTSHVSHYTTCGLHRSAQNLTL